MNPRWQRLIKWARSGAASWFWLALLAGVLLFRLLWGGCSLLLCGLFISIVVAYTIINNREDS